MLENLKLMLGFESDFTDKDPLLKLIISQTTSRLKILLGGLEPPEELDHIILDVAIIRFNRIGSEGLSSHSVEGESQTFSASDFDGYMDEIEAFLANQRTSTRGKVVFL